MSSVNIDNSNTTLLNLLQYCEDLGDDRNTTITISISRTDDLRRKVVTEPISCGLTISYFLKEGDELWESDYYNSNCGNNQLHTTSSIGVQGRDLSILFTDAMSGLKKDLEFRSIVR